MSAAPEFDEQIARLVSACEEGARELAQLREEARGRCCPWCVHGGRFEQLYQAQRTRVIDAVLLLRHRGRVEDFGEAVRALGELWP